jgi:hypothetical protein
MARARAAWAGPYVCWHMKKGTGGESGIRLPQFSANHDDTYGYA